MKKFTLTSLVLAGVFVLSGCVDVTFSEPMPLNRRDRPFFPKNSQGVWYEKSANDNLSDSIAIYSEFIDLGEKPLILNKNTTLRKFNGYFVFSTCEDDENGRWHVYLAKLSNSVLSLYEFDGGDEEKVTIWEEVLLGDAVEKLKRDDSEKLKEIRLSPSSNHEFRELINKGGLSHMGDYVR